MRRMIYLITFLIVYYNASYYKLVVYEYEKEEFGVEVTCAEGVTDCKDSREESPDRELERLVDRLYGSYYKDLPVVIVY